MSDQSHNNELEEYVKRIKEESNSYERTIQTLIAFDSAIRWDDTKRKFFPNSNLFPGRKLEKTSNTANGNVTPDIVIQMNDEYGIIAEIKLTASNIRDFKNAHEQLKKYDQELLGWKTKNEKIRIHDISLLLDDINRNRALRYFENEKFNRSFSLIACIVYRRTKEFCKIEKYFGNFENTMLNKKFIDPVEVSLEKIIHLFSSIKFYDAEPPIEYTMNILWMHVFNEIRDKEGKKKEISVSCDEVTEILREKYSFKQLDDRQPKIPRRRWISKALHVFVNIGLAIKDLNDRDKFYVTYRSRKDSMIDYFSERHFKKKSKDRSNSEELKQLELKFNSTND